ncbi:ArsR family transcriptional regulator [Deinococcus psychrotolerans]|uniref:ArsR family transcriptional regulator n=1 Tax=Deinococcus psychrotolerans TaxID=2489213 RepID=A0A3G8YBT5_9DEIO|nr:winged helix-turn-helix domain-containing protein [Deinococcus psychrotolerans]AZI42400.1 ArsR family transcriptional regulator [Deinococcus psychrotolerans]
MSQIQLDSLQMNDLAAARALRQDSKFLAHFIVPLSPSEVAPRLGMAANLAHHHARKLVDVGLLFEQSREGGKVLYQLAAREFRVSSDLLPPEDEAGNGSANMRGLSAGFLQAYERSWRNMNEGQEDVYGFGTTERPAHLNQLSYPVSDEAYPTHSDTLTLRLTPERFQQLARSLSALLDEAQAEGVREEGTACTLAVLVFQAEPSQPEQLSRNQDSFLGWPPVKARRS